MGTDRELYYMAVQKEQDYLNYINTFYPGRNFPTLSKALTTMFNTSGINTSHKDGLTKTQGESILRGFEKNGSISNVLKNGVSNFIAREISQIQGLKDSGDVLRKKVAGYVDEAFLVSQLKESFKTMAKETKRTNINNMIFDSPVIDYKGSSSSDFTIIFKCTEITFNDRNESFPNEVAMHINLENKLNLSHFHIAKGTLKTGEIGVNNILNDFFYIMKEKHQDLDINMDDYLMEKYVSYIRKDDFNQILANYIMYKKLSTSIPIFVSPDSSGIKFKLCSELIYEIGHGNFQLDTEIQSGEKFEAVGANTREIKTKLIDQAIKKVGKYNLWYGRP